ncbi:hypothetical protein NN561_014472 [Cricetulus griseus]
MKKLRARAPPRVLASGLVHFRPAGLPFTWHGGCPLVPRGVARTTAARGGLMPGGYAVRPPAESRGRGPTTCGDTAARAPRRTEKALC